MATHAGHEGAVYVGANQVAEVKDFQVDESHDVLEDTVLGDTDRTYKAGISSWNGSINCLWDETDTNGQEALTIGASVTLNLYPEGNTSGDAYLTGTAFITSVGVKSSFDGMVERSFTFQGSGALSKSTVV